MNTQTDRLASLEAGLRLLSSCLVNATRDDGSEYRMLREDCPMHDDLQHVVRECHRGELPNDWRFELIYDLCHGLLEYSEPEPEPWSEERYLDVLPEVADHLTDIHTASLLQWLADDVSRIAFEDDAYAEGCNDIADLAQKRQYEEIELTGSTLLEGLEALAD